MSKAKNKDAALPSNYEELSDFEFIAYADYLSSPYYKSYMEARNRSNIITKRDPYEDAIMASPRGAKTSLGTVYKRRKGFLALVAIFMLVIIAIAALGYLGTIVPEYVSAFVKPGEEVAHLGLTDPVLGALTKFAKMDMTSQFYTDCLAPIDGDTKIASLIAFYGMPIAIALALIFALIIFIVAIVAIAKKGVSKGYVARKCNIGFLSLLVFLLSLFVAAAAIIWNGAALSASLDFFTGKATNVYAGYGLLGLMGVSLLSFICNLFAYKKVRR